MKGLSLFLLLLATVATHAQPGDGPDFARNSRVNQLQQAIEDNPSCARCHCELAELVPSDENLFRAMLYDSLCSGSTSLLMAKRALRMGSEEDFRYYTELAKHYGNYSEELYSLALAAHSDPDSYERWLEEALSHFPRYPWFLSRKAYLLHEQGNYPHADSVFRFAVNQLSSFPQVETPLFIGSWIDLIATSHPQQAKVWAHTLISSTTGANDRFWTAQRIGRWYDMVWNEPDSAIAFYSLAIDIASEHKGSGSEYINGLSSEAGMRRGVCYLKKGDMPSAQSDWFYSVMFEYDEHSDIETTLNELSGAYPESEIVRALQWILRQNQEYHYGPKEGPWLTKHISSYMHAVRKSEQQQIVTLCAARAYVWDGQCRKAMRMFRKAPNEWDKSFLYQDAKKLVKRCVDKSERKQEQN
ncbi:MAG: tetratricopeptide repeat protein [Flavobacteriales bacterium]